MWVCDCVLTLGPRKEGAKRSFEPSFVLLGEPVSTDLIVSLILN